VTFPNGHSAKIAFSFLFHHRKAFIHHFRSLLTYRAPGSNLTFPLGSIRPRRAKTETTPSSCLWLRRGWRRRGVCGFAFRCPDLTTGRHHWSPERCRVRGPSPGGRPAGADRVSGGVTAAWLARTLTHTTGNRRQARGLQIIAHPHFPSFRLTFILLKCYSRELVKSSTTDTVNCHHPLPPILGGKTAW
jgi:hypothetical protein